MLSTRSGAVVKGIRHIESKRVRLDSRRPAIRAAKLGKPTPGLASLKPWMEIARRWNLSEREKQYWQRIYNEDAGRQNALVFDMNMLAEEWKELQHCNVKGQLPNCPLYDSLPKDAKKDAGNQGAGPQRQQHADEQRGQGHHVRHLFAPLAPAAYDAGLCWLQRDLGMAGDLDGLLVVSLEQAVAARDWPCAV